MKSGIFVSFFNFLYPVPRIETKVLLVGPQICVERILTTILWDSAPIFKFGSWRFREQMQLVQGDCNRGWHFWRNVSGVTFGHMELEIPGTYLVSVVSLSRIQKRFFPPSTPKILFDAMSPFQAIVTHCQVSQWSLYRSSSSNWLMGVGTSWSSSFLSLSSLASLGTRTSVSFIISKN